MALLRKIFFRKPPDGLFEISERVYVFDYCFTTDVVENDSYKAYISGIASQLRSYFPEGSFLVFNFREGEGQSKIASILSDHEMTVMDYPRQYEGCPLLTMEVIHHFLRSCESWLLVGQNNVLLMHCERGGWPILSFMLAGLLIYRKQYAAEQKILNMIHKQAPHELLQMFSSLNPIPSQLRYLKYISRRNLSSEWPPKNRDLTLDCIILRSIPNMDGKGGCRPILRIYGQDPLLASDPSPKVLFSIPKKSKLVRLYKQVECGLVKIDVNCHIKGDVLLECINLDDDLQHESTMFRIMFNTSFVRSNISMLNVDEIDILWDTKDLFPKEFRAEVIFSEMDVPISAAALSLPAILDKDELPCDAFAKVHEFFNNVDWMDPKPDVSLNVIDQITISAPLREKSPCVRDQTEACSIEDSSHSELEEKLTSQTSGKQELPVEALHTDLIQEKLDPVHTMALAVIKGMTTPSSGQKAANVESSSLQTPKAIQSSDTSENGNESSMAVVLDNQEVTSEPCSDAALIEENAEPQVKNASSVLWHNQETPSHEGEKPPLDASGSDEMNRKETSEESDGKFEHSMSKDLENQGSIIESAPQKLYDKPRSQTLETTSSSPSIDLQKQTKPPSGTPLDTISNKTKTQLEGLLPALQKPPVSKIISPRFSQSPHSGPVQKSSSLPSSPSSVSRYRGASPSLGITTILDGSSQSSVESPSLVKKTRSVQSSPQSPISSPPAPPPPLSSWRHPDASGAAELSPLSSRSGLGNSSDDQHDITPVKRKTAPSLLSSRKTSPEPPASPSYPPSKPPPPPPPPPPPSSSAAGSSGSSGSVPPPPVLPPSIRNVSKPPPPPPPPPVNAKSGGTTTTTPPPPPLPPIASGSVSSTSSEVPQPPTPPNVSITSPRSRVSPPFPPAPAPPCAQGFSNGSPQPPPVPGSKGPVPPAPGPPSSKGRALTRSLAKNQNQSKKTTLKPYHWLKLNRVVQGSLWAEAQKTGEVSQAPEFDMSEIENLFSASAPNSKNRGLGGKSNSGVSGPKSDKIQLIELRRAYNCEIMLSKVKVPLPDLMNSVLALDDTGLDIDQVENLIKFCPTKEEMELLKGYKGDKENLGKCEQFFLELMKVPRVESKLRVFCFKMQFTSQVSDLRKNLNIVNSTSEEVRGSEKLRRIMHTILQLGNALNQGTTRGSAVGFRLDSLLKLTDTRARNSKMTLMHYLCKVLAEKLPDLLDFPQDLVSLEASTKIQLKILAEEMQAISKGLEKLAQELTASQNDGPVSETFCKLLKVFLSQAEGEVRSLASLYSNVGRNADALAMYFGEDPAKCPFEQVVSTLLNFSRMFTRAHEENCKQLEFEKKKAEKEAEKEKQTMSSPHQSATKMDDFK